MAYTKNSSINSNEFYQDGAEEDEPDINEINVTNQLIGEVQGFIFLLRWLVYEFYSFKKLRQ